MEDNKIIYDLVKETRDDVKALNEKLNTHILNTSKSLVEAKAPQTFLKTAQMVFLWMCAIAGASTAVTNLFANHKP